MDKGTVNYVSMNAYVVETYVTKAQAVWIPSGKCSYKVTIKRSFEMFSRLLLSAKRLFVETKKKFHQKNIFVVPSYGWFPLEIKTV